MFYFLSQRPIGAKTRRIDDPSLVLVLHGSSDQKQVVCKEIADLSDYYNPHSPGNLISHICHLIFNLNSSLFEKLAKQLPLTIYMVHIKYGKDIQQIDGITNTYIYNFFKKHL